MLDTLAVMKELEKSVPKLFQEMADEKALLKQLYEWLVEHSESLRSLSLPYQLPEWEGAFNKIVPVKAQEYPYEVLGTDGSQIYPDKHQGVPCYLLNTGSAGFSYGTTSRVVLSSAPEVVTLLDDTISEDIVNLRRAEREFEVGLDKALRMKSPVCLSDGALLFWHLEAKSPALKERFLKRYFGLLEGYYEHRIPISGYISMPRSRDLVSFLRNALHIRAIKQGSCDTLVDTDLVSLFLPEAHRTNLFTHTSALAQAYPPPLRPCFFYLHGGHEIARVEVPAWVAQDAQLIERVVHTIYDQIVKGNGYPVCLTEAHEQAVVKSADRQQFFQLLQRLHRAHNRRMPVSQKSLKKRYVSL